MYTVRLNTFFYHKNQNFHEKLSNPILFYTAIYYSKKQVTRFPWLISGTGNIVLTILFCENHKDNKYCKILYNNGNITIMV